MVMPIVYDIVFYLCLLDSDPHAFHRSDHSLVWHYSVSSHDNPRDFVPLSSKIIPFAVFYLVYLEPRIGVHIQDTPQHLLGVGSQHFRLLVFSRHDLFVELVGIGILKREVPAEHRVEDDSARPDIDVEALVSFAGDHLGSGIAGRATSSLEFFSGLVLVAESEVYDFDPFVFVEEQVLRLEVAMNDPVFVYILDP